MINSKKKGNAWENKLANWLRDNGVKAWKDGASGGGSREKGDIGNNLDMTIESKAAKNVKLMEWWEQVRGSASIHHNAPVLFIHQDGMPENKWLVVMDNDDWLDSVKKPKESDYTDPKLKWTFQRMIDSTKAVMKLLENNDSNT